MFVDTHDLDEADYICLLLILNSTRQEGYSVEAAKLIEEMKKLVSWADAVGSINKLGEKSLIYFTQKDQQDSSELTLEGYVGLRWSGLAVLINYAESYLERINRRFGDLPENLVATLIPFLELTAVPAADRFVSTKDNVPEFQRLERELEKIRLEILKDENRNALPIPEKKAVLADIDSVLAQIRDGMVRLSDLTTRIRPLVRNLAEWCKDIAIIAGAASAAYLAIDNILQKIF